MRKSIYALFVFIFIISCNLLYSQQQSPDDFIKNKLAQYQASIKTMQGSLTYIIEARQKIIQHGVFYFQSPDKLRMDFTDPVKNSIIQNGVNSYIKAFTASQYSKVDNQNAVAQSDLYGFNLLSTYTYTVNKDYKSSQPTANTLKVITQPAIASVYYGFANVNNTMVLSAIIYYDSNKDQITSYKLVGSASMMQSTIMLKGYKTINNINIPCRIECLVHVQGMSVKSAIVLKNVILNSDLNPSTFVAQ